MPDYLMQMPLKLGGTGSSSSGAISWAVRDITGTTLIAWQNAPGQFNVSSAEYLAEAGTIPYDNYFIWVRIAYPDSLADLSFFLTVGWKGGYFALNVLAPMGLIPIYSIDPSNERNVIVETPASGTLGTVYTNRAEAAIGVSGGAMNKPNDIQAKPKGILHHWGDGSETLHTSLVQTGPIVGWVNTAGATSFYRVRQSGTAVHTYGTPGNKALQTRVADTLGRLSKPAYTFVHPQAHFTYDGDGAVDGTASFGRTFDIEHINRANPPLQRVTWVTQVNINVQEQRSNTAGLYFYTGEGNERLPPNTRALLLGQSNPIENGLWLYQGPPNNVALPARPIWVRPDDFLPGTTLLKGRSVTFTYPGVVTSARPFYGVPMALTTDVVVGTTPQLWSAAQRIWHVHPLNLSSTVLEPLLDKEWSYNQYRTIGGVEAFRWQDEILPVINSRTSWEGGIVARGSTASVELDDAEYYLIIHQVIDASGRRHAVARVVPGAPVGFSLLTAPDSSYFTAVAEGSGVRVSKFTSGTASREARALIADARSPSLWRDDTETRYLGACKRSTRRWYVWESQDDARSFTQMVEMWPEFVQVPVKGGNEISLLDGGAASVKVQTGSKIVFFRRSPDHVTWPTEAPYAPVEVGVLPAAVRDVKVTQKVASGEVTLIISDGKNWNRKSEAMGAEGSWEAF